MACSDSEVDLDKIPLIALNMSLRKKLGQYLNPRNTVAADWMAVAEAMGYTYLEIRNYEVCRGPTEKVLEDWGARSSDASVGKLLSILTELDRNDIVEDLRPLIGALMSIFLFIFCFLNDCFIAKNNIKYISIVPPVLVRCFRK